jgi:hypothetical protein
LASTVPLVQQGHKVLPEEQGTLVSDGKAQLVPLDPQVLLELGVVKETLGHQVLLETVFQEPLDLPVLEVDLALALM